MFRLTAVGPDVTKTLLQRRCGEQLVNLGAQRYGVQADDESCCDADCKLVLHSAGIQSNALQKTVFANSN